VIETLGEGETTLGKGREETREDERRAEEMGGLER